MNQEAFLPSAATQDVHRAERINSSFSTFLAYLLSPCLPDQKKKSLRLLLGNASAETVVKCVSLNRKILFTNVEKKAFHPFWYSYKSTQECFLVTSPRRFGLISLIMLRRLFVDGGGWLASDRVKRIFPLFIIRWRYAPPSHPLADGLFYYTLIIAQEIISRLVCFAGWYPTIIIARWRRASLPAEIGRNWEEQNEIFYLW